MNTLSVMIPCPAPVRLSSSYPCCLPSVSGARQPSRTAGVTPATTCTSGRLPAGNDRRGLNSSSRLVPCGLSNNLQGGLKTGPLHAPPPPPEEVTPHPEAAGGMVPIGSETRGITGEAAFGPLSVLLIGFLPEDLRAFTNLLQDMEAGMVKVIPCTKRMLAGTLQQALEVASPPAYEAPALGQRRALVLSGMYGSEVIDVVSSYKEAGLPPAVFAAAVPNNYKRVVSELVEEVYADHNAMKQRAAQRAAQGQQQQ